MFIKIYGIIDAKRPLYIYVLVDPLSFGQLPTYRTIYLRREGKVRRCSMIQLC